MTHQENEYDHGGKIFWNDIVYKQMIINSIQSERQENEYDHGGKIFWDDIEETEDTDEKNTHSNENTPITFDERNPVPQGAPVASRSRQLFNKDDADIKDIVKNLSNSLNDDVDI